MFCIHNVVMPTKKRRQSRSKRKRGTRRVGGGNINSSAPSHCDKNMFEKYNTPQYRSALNTIIRELLKYNPLAIIEFIEQHFNETSILAHFKNDDFKNDECIKNNLGTLKRKFSEYNQKFVKTNTEKYEKITMETAYNILYKGFAKFSVSKLQEGGADGDDSEDEDEQPPPDKRIDIIPEEEEERGVVADRAENTSIIWNAYLLGVGALAFYNLEYLRETFLAAAMEVDPNMVNDVGVMTASIIFSILMFIIMSLGIAEQLGNVRRLFFE